MPDALTFDEFAPARGASGRAAPTGGIDIGAIASAEGASAPVAAIARSIYQQESSSGRNTATSNAGAVGGMQMTPATFSRFAKPGEDIRDPVANARAAVRYLSYLEQKNGGDIAQVPAGYYGGEGAMAKARNGVSVSDPRNPNAPNTLQYNAQVLQRAGLGPDARVGTEKGRKTNTSQPAAQALTFDEFTPAAKPDRALAGRAGDLAAGAIRGAGSIGATLLSPLDYAARKLNGGQPVNLTVPGTDLSFEFGGDRRQGMTDALSTLGADTGSNSFAVGKVGGELAGTLGVGGGLARGAAAVAPTLAARAVPLLAAIETGGLSSGSVGGLSGLGLRAAGGAAAGAAAAGMSGGDGQDAAQAAFLGGMLPVGLGAVGKAAALATGIVKPFTGAGQDRIVGDILRRYAHDPEAAAQALAQYRQVVQGSVPLTSAAAGDVGLAGLTRTMQAVNPQTANEIAMRGTAQNAARTSALEEIAGTPAAVDLAKAARGALTAPMREDVLQRAGKIDSGNLVGQLDDLIRNPNNAGSTNRDALDRVRRQVVQSTDETGGIDARALYEIRKDIGLAMQGKLQGDAGNLRHARGVLGGVQSMFDDAIGSASARAAGPVPVGGTPDPWRGYLSTFASESKPINQMEALQDALKRVQTGTTDMQGNPLISAAKLNNLLKNEGDALKQTLSPSQLQRLHEVAADANAARLGLESGKAVGSNTVQNLSQSWLLQRVFGGFGESPMVSSVLRKPLGLIYGSANEQITDRLSRALLDPTYASQLLQASAPRAVRGSPGTAGALLGVNPTGSPRGLLD